MCTKVFLVKSLMNNLVHTVGSNVSNLLVLIVFRGWKGILETFFPLLDFMFHFGLW